MSACEATSGCYELYSIGSAKFLREIFNSVAMITGSGDFLGACAVAVMLGVILAVIKGIMTGGGKIEVGAIVVSSLVTCIMFVPRATVVVEDVYNGSTYAVDNVPIGVAAPGMFISRVGFTIAELMDQGFSTVDTNFGITNRPFLESTKILSNLRNPQFANSVWDQLGKHTNSDVKRSFYNFFKECTMLKYNFDKTKSVDQDQKMTLEKLMDDFQSNVFYTEIYVDGKAVTKTCNDANAILKSKINQLNGDLVNNAMPAPKEYGSNTASEMTDAISMLRLTSADAMEMVKLSIVQPVYDKALAGYFDNSGDVVAALTINNAIQQRNAQWSMEQSLFLNTVRPIITFFEGFVYAVTPFMAILICMGAFGLGIAVKYFQTLIWIQLWMPILAIINLYIYMSAQGAVDSAGIVDKHIDSFYALGTLAQTVETWTSVGGMLAAMTPVIAFFIVAGSAYTFTSIASKLNGADHIDEKAMSPDVLKQAPMFTNSNGTYVNDNMGQTKAGAAPNEPMISLSRIATTLEQSALSRKNSATLAYNQEYANMYKIAVNAHKGKEFTEQFGLNHGHSDSNGYSENSNVGSATSFSGMMGFNHTAGESRVTTAGYGVKGTISGAIKYAQDLWNNQKGNGGNEGKAPKKNLSGEVQATAEGFASWARQYIGQNGFNNTQGNSVQNTDTVTTGQNKIKQHNDSKNSTKNDSAGEKYNFDQLFGHDRVANLKQSRSDMQSAENNYTNAHALNQSVGTKEDLSARAVVQSIGENGDWNGLRRLIQNNNLGELYNQKKAFLENQIGYSSDVAEKAALFMTAAESKNNDCQMKALSMVGGATGYNIDLEDPSKDKNINTVEPKPSNVPTDAELAHGIGSTIGAVGSGTVEVWNKIQTMSQKPMNEYNGASRNEQQLSEAEVAYQKINEDLKQNWEGAVKSINNSYKVQQGRQDDDKQERFGDKKYLTESFTNSIGSNPMKITNDEKDLLYKLYTVGNGRNWSSQEIDKLVDLYSDKGIDNTVAKNIINTLASSTGFQKEELTEDVMKNNITRENLFWQLNVAKSKQSQYLQKNNDLYQKVLTGFDHLPIDPTTAGTLNGK